MISERLMYKALMRNEFVRHKGIETDSYHAAVVAAENAIGSETADLVCEKSPILWEGVEQKMRVVETLADLIVKMRTS